jgi:mitofusin
MPVISSISLQAIDEFNFNRSRLKVLIENVRDILSSIVGESDAEKYPLYFPVRVNENPAFEQACSAIRASRSAERRVRNLNGLQIINLSNTSVSRIDEDTLTSLDPQSTRRLLLVKLLEIVDYLERLENRISSNVSKVLVVGDVNSGKSTFVNALLNADILPSDQQPCTQAFTEVVIGQRKTVVHAIASISEYNPENSSTYATRSYKEFFGMVQEDPSQYSWFRLLLGEDFPVDTELRQNLRETALIDSPGLNCDSFKTMALFAQQEDIDIVVFLLNAANHLTLSAREFLEAAGVDKADNIFIVINRFDDINNKERCKKQIHQQINELFPEKFSITDLFFVSSRAELEKSCKEFSEEFGQLRARLVEYLFKRKTRTKLLPARKYVATLLDDLIMVVGHNVRLSQSEIDHIELELTELLPTFEAMQGQEAMLTKDLESKVSESCSRIYSSSYSTLSEGNSQLVKLIMNEPWRGIFGLVSFQKRVHLMTVHTIAHSFACVRKQCNAEVTSCMKGLLRHSTLKTGLELSYYPDAQISIQEQAISQCWRWYQLIDIRKEFFNYKSLVGASSFFAAVFGYQPLTSVLMNISGTLLGSVSLFGYIMIALGGSLGFLLFVDFEGIFKRGLISRHDQEYTTQWCHEQARRIENTCRSVLSGTQASILSQFYEAISRQRQLKLQKDAHKALHQTRTSHFSSLRGRLQSLRSEVTDLYF